MYYVYDQQIEFFIHELRFIYIDFYWGWAV